MKTLILASVFFLVGCSNVVVCQDVKEWSPAEQVGMANDMALLPADSPVRGAMIDYARMRAEARACKQ